MPRPLSWTVGAHLLLAIVCAAAFQVDLPPIGGVHPALKPFKFAVSIALFLATMAVLLPYLAVPPALRGVLAWTLAITMVIEMVPIVVQSLRGTRSHFNQAQGFDAATWILMVLAIVVATAAMAIIVGVASLRPLMTPQGPLSPLLTFAWRAGLWLLLLAPVTGFAMGARLQHSVGGADGGSGLPLLNWSVVHGDLRVAHFFALHALQFLPLLAWFAERRILSPGLRWGLLGVGVFVMGALCFGTLVQAGAGQPWVRRILGSNTPACLICRGYSAGRSFDKRDPWPKATHPRVLSVELITFSHFADKLTDEMTKNNGFARPGPGEEQDLIVNAVCMTTLKHFLKDVQYQKKRLDPEIVQLGAVGHRAIQREVTDDQNRGGSIVVAFYGEDHDSLPDGRRALDFLASTERQHDGLPNVLVLEKGLRNARQRGGQRIVYDTGDSLCNVIIDEANLTRSNDAPLEYRIQYQSIWAFGLTKNQRSMVVAAYLAAALANSTQSAIERIAILFGAEHANILTEYLESYIQTVATNLWARRRYYVFATSLGR